MYHIRTLIDISQTVTGYQLHLEDIDLIEYMKRIESQANSLCITNGICLHMEIGTSEGCFKADKLLLERAIMNVIHNALDHSPQGGNLYVTAQKADGFLKISVTDEGDGFTPETLHHAKEQFFMGNRSRNLNLHFGLGLYITNTIVAQHNGQLILENSSETKGGQVTIKIPY